MKHLRFKLTNNYIALTSMLKVNLIHWLPVKKCKSCCNCFHEKGITSALCICPRLDTLTQPIIPLDSASLSLPVVQLLGAKVTWVSCYLPCRRALLIPYWLVKMSTGAIEHNNIILLIIVTIDLLTCGCFAIIADIDWYRLAKLYLNELTRHQCCS